MPALGNSYLQLIDLMKRSGPDGAVSANVVEALHTLNPVMKDANVQTCNQGTKHMSVIRTGLPSVSWGQLYKGIAQSKSTTQQVEDTTGFLEGLSTVDTRLLDISKDPAAVRMSEAQPFLESMSQEFERSFFYSDVGTTPTKFHGMAPRYNTLASPNVVAGGGSGSDNTSIWFVTYGDHATSLIVPEGITAGVVREDKGDQRVLDGSGNAYYVKEELFRQHVGVCVKDWRFNARVCNIDVSNVIAGSVQLNPLMRAAYYKMQGRRNYAIDNGGAMIGATRTVIYMNRTLLEALDAESTNDGSADNFIRLRPMEIQGEEVMTWRGIPIRDTDNLLNTETLVA
jgi:hypothetical protein